MERHEEQEQNDYDVREASCQNPRFELAYLSASFFDEHAHEGVVASVENSAHDEDDANCCVFCSGQSFCEEDKQGEIGVDKSIGHVTADTTK